MLFELNYFPIIDRNLIDGYEIGNRFQYKLYNDFRKIPICLTFDEIRNNIEPTLHRNIISGQYSSANKYLDIHYNLLREDLNRWLRRGINEYKELINSGEDMPKIKGIKVYESVRIGKRFWGSKSLNTFWAKFDTKKLGSIDWKYSKRLIYGVLLCLSSNNFHTFCFASVAGDRSEEHLSEGLFQLEFVTENLTEEFKHIDPNASFVMIESEVYYEAYRHNLTTLKRFYDNNFPLKKYIIELNKSVWTPKYINESTVYELSTVSGIKCVKLIRDWDRWPNADQMDFDTSQYKAYQKALSRDFVLIQGPPGTGKTFVGLKIVQTLHQNRRFWSDCLTNHNPIVVICYTNHALDQFLEGMLRFCDKVIRIGNQSKSELLKENTIKSIRHKTKGKEFCPKESKEIAYYFKIMKNIYSNITEIDLEIINCRTDLLNPRHLYDFLDESNQLNHYNWFELQMKSLLENYSNEFDLALIKWLTNCDYRQTVEEEVNGFEDTNEDNRNNIQGLEADEQEVNYLIESRENDNNSEFDFSEVKVEVFNTIFKTNDKSLKQISKRVIKHLKDKISIESISNEMMDFEEALNYRDVTQLSHCKRWKLYRLWVNVYVCLKKDCFNKLNNEFDVCVKALRNLELKKDLYLIKGSEIVGMTTTGAAKFRPIIEAINPKIVVIEEAAEVLECHVITSLTKHIQHLILIGDHKQLKPQPSVYELAKRFNLDVSLFERMIMNDMPFNQLKLQHRMRPEISKLLVPHIYRQLQDHESVKHYEDVKGVKRNMFFINHSYIESSNDDRMSKSNEFEAKFIVRLCKHFLLQDYNSSQITILTLYSSQLILIRQLLKLDPIFDGIEANSVDNFQGEENDIILLSFVRSNHNNETGFLKVPNRVNVALSRAKKGLYCVGNFDCLSNSCELWTKITNYLRKVNAIGPALELKCVNHLEQLIKVSTVEDFNLKSPHGGCSQTYHCYDLKCGHSCTLNICHVRHSPCLVKVEKIVERCGHKIKENCSGDMFCYHSCDKTLDCGHECDKKCGEECQTECQKLCAKTLMCGHNCKLQCYETCDPNSCDVLVERQLEDCGHQMMAECSQDLNTLECIEECEELLLCGHRCEGTCFKCNQSRLHTNCQQKCERKLICCHDCSGICGQNCPPCDQICQNSCDHNKCIQTCSQPCIQCSESFQSKCKHKKLMKMCSELCDSDVCQMSCTKKLRCGHRCIGVCGEKCLKFCLDCHKSRIHELYGIEGMSVSQIKSSKFIELENCEHIIELNALKSLLIFCLITNIDVFINCPKCGSTITRCKPLNDLIQKQFSELNERNRIYFCYNEMNNKPKQKRLFLEIDEMSSVNWSALVDSNENVGSITENILHDLKEETEFNRKLYIRSKYQLYVIENKVKAIKTLSDVMREMNGNKEFMNFSKRQVWREFQSKQISRYYKRMESFLNFISNDFENSLQQISDTEQELKFFVVYSKCLSIAINCIEHQNSEQLVNALDTILSIVFTEEIETNFIAEVLQIIGENSDLNCSEIKLKPNNSMNVLQN